MIASETFQSCSGLERVTLSCNVEYIGDYAFYNCPNLSLYGPSGSYAETYAKEHDIPFNPAPTPEVTLDVSANGNTTGGSLVASASAANGTGSYTYCYELYQNGALTRQTEYTSDTTHTFAIYEAGTYQVVIHAKDRIGMIGSAYGGTVEFTDAECTTISGRVLDDMGNPVEGATVSIRQNTEAAMLMTLSRSADLAATVLTDANGQWTWDQAILGATYSISAAKDGMTFETVISAVVDTIWGMIVEPLHALGLGYTTTTAPSSLSGMVTTADGAAVQGVSVIVTKADGTRVANVITSENGTWGVSGLTAGTQYTVTYGENQMTVEPATETVTLSNDNMPLTAVAELISGEASDVVTFTMEQSSIFVGYSAKFTVTVPADVTKARLVVDGNAYDVIYPVNGVCEYSRVFSKGGDRQVAFQIAKDGVWADISAEQTLNVISDGQLEAPVYADITSHYTGTELTIDWNDVKNAQNYVVWLYYDGVPVNSFQTTESVYTVPANEFPMTGTYGVSVMATGKGYDQSAADDTFTVEARNYTFTLESPKTGYTYVVGDQVDMTLTQSGGGYLAVKVVEPSGKTTWFPQSETGLTGDESVWLPFTVSEVGTHSVTPYLYTVSEIKDGIQPYLVGKTVEFTVNGPSIRGIYPAGGSYTWIYSSESGMLRVKTNNAAESVSVYEGDTLLASVSGEGAYSEENYIRTFTLNLTPALAKGKHTITVKAGDQDSSAVASKDYSFYVVNSVTDGSEVYPQANQIKLYSSPLNGKQVATANGGTTIDKLTIIGDAGDWYMVRMADAIAKNDIINLSDAGDLDMARTADATEGFVPRDQVDVHAWEGATGSIVITCPSAGIKLPRNVGKYLLFSWDTGLIVPEGAEYTVTVDALVGNTCIKETVTANEVPILISRMPSDEYTVTVTLKNGDKTIGTSAPVTFVMGDFSLEQAYIDWWLDSIAPKYTEYMQTGEPFYGNVSVWYGWNGFVDTEINAAIRPKIIFDAATLGYTQILQDFKDLQKDSTTNAENNWALTLTDQAAVRRTMLLNISAAMLNETEKGNLKLNEQMDNVDSIAVSNQTIAIREAASDAMFASLDVISKGVSVGVQTYAATQGGALDEAVDPFLEAFDRVMQAFEKTVESMNKATATAELLSAYADVYVSQMKCACDAYVECLETTYRDDDWGVRGSYSSYVQEYIQAFESIKNEKNTVANSSRMYDAAINQILDGTGYTAADIDRMQQVSVKQYAAVLSVDLVRDLVLNFLNDAAKVAYKEIFGENAKLHGEVFRYDEQSGSFEINGAAMVEGSIGVLLPKVGEILIRQAYLDSIAQNIQDALEGKIELPANHISIAETFMKGDVKEWNRVCSLVLGIAHDSWDLGVALSELGTAISVSSDQAKNKGIFDTYGLRLISSLKLHVDAQGVGGLANYDWNAVKIDPSWVDRLDKYRQALVTLTNHDTNIMVNYRNMRLINDKNGNKFNYGIKWMTIDEIDTRIDLIESYRKIFLYRPAVFDSLFDD